MFTTSKHHPDGGASPHFDNLRLESLIAAHRTGTAPAALAEIVTLTQDRALTLIRFHKTTRYSSEAELLSDVHLKLLRAVDKFDPTKGTAFTFLSRVVTNALCTAVTNARRTSSRFTELDQDVLHALPAEVEDRTGIDDLDHRIRTEAKTTLTDPGELSTQRWFVASFCEDGFESRRHECVNAAQVVHGMSHSRCCELYDLTMLEVRRVLFHTLPPRAPIAPGRLVGRRAQWMTRYADLMDAGEFTKFVVLLRDLSPFVVILVNPESRSRRQDRSPQVTRRNIEFVLNGHLDAVPLFT
jgi:hypothetical protein